MYFLIKDDGILNTYNTTWDKVSADIKKKIESKPVYNKNFLKTKIKLYGDETTDFHNKEAPKRGSNYNCLAVISLDSALDKDESYYLQVFVKKCRYVEKEKKLLGILLSS